MLTIENLDVHFTSNGSGPPVTALEKASLKLGAGRTLALIGESGSGKSILGLAVCGLLPSSARVAGGIFFSGSNLLKLPREKMRSLRGRRIAFVPQSAGLSLNPTMVCGCQVSEIYLHRRGYARGKARVKAREILSRLGLLNSICTTHPHRLSGGMRQRVLVAMGLAGSPDILIADEPTKGIDHSRRSDVIDMFVRLREKKPDMAMLLITHDLDLAEKVSDEVAVMYAGNILECTPARRFFETPLHPYSRALMKALPERGLVPIPGTSPRPGTRPEGCVFHPRCIISSPECLRCRPPERNMVVNGGDQGMVRCWRHARA
ncbi:MAG: ABC transporter ATP-binding protein [Desulfamplus sp.]|nr:ABC transporter ATP-binding protein [Desulfamplus sp.]